MVFNLIYEKWIPVRLRNGKTESISPAEIFRGDIVYPDWPRSDLNINCIELLIGMVFASSPPRNIDEWRNGPPSPEELKKSLEKISEAFNLNGSGQRFMQDNEAYDPEKELPVERLYIDAPGENTYKLNKDLFIRSGQLQDNDLPTLAMALYTIQNIASTGGQGHYTSMRGGGHVSTIVAPANGSLGDIIWANIPYGEPCSIHDFEWMNGNINKGKIITPNDVHPVNAFFACPRRIFLSGEDKIKSICTKTHGVRYDNWVHPITPYIEKMDDAKKKSFKFSVRADERLANHSQWQGIIIDADNSGMITRHKAACISEYENRIRGSKIDYGVIISGWVMDKSKAVVYIQNFDPVVPFNLRAKEIIKNMVYSSAIFEQELIKSLKLIKGKTIVLNDVSEQYFAYIYNDLNKLISKLMNGHDEKTIMAEWLEIIKSRARIQFDNTIKHILPRAKDDDVKAILNRRAKLFGLFNGKYDKGKEIYTMLGVE